MMPDNKQEQGENNGMKKTLEQDADDKPKEKPISNNNLPTISLIMKPSPPRTLNDLEEAGRIRLIVYSEHLQKNNAEMPVKYVSAKITNNNKTRFMISLPRMTTDGDLNNNDNFGGEEEGEEGEDAIKYSSTELVQKGLHTWYGEIVIPCNWLEGGSKTFERTGSFSPYYDDSLFTMTISCTLFNNQTHESKKSIVELHSTDAFHWKQE
jgi:hypothetical protein